MNSYSSIFYFPSNFKLNLTSFDCIRTSIIYRAQLVFSLCIMGLKSEHYNKFCWGITGIKADSQSKVEVRTGRGKWPLPDWRSIAYSGRCLLIFLIYCFYHHTCLCNNFYGLPALVGCWSSAFIRRIIYKFLNVCPFYYTNFAVSGKVRIP